MARKDAETNSNQSVQKTTSRSRRVIRIAVVALLVAGVGYSLKGLIGAPEAIAQTSVEQQTKPATTKDCCKRTSFVWTSA